MNFSIHIDPTLAKDLEGIAKKIGKTRNSIISEALRNFVQSQRKSKWPKAVLELAGADKQLTPFENSRTELSKIPEDPFS